LVIVEEQFLVKRLRVAASVLMQGFISLNLMQRSDRKLYQFAFVFNIFTFDYV